MGKLAIGSVARWATTAPTDVASLEVRESSLACQATRPGSTQRVRTDGEH